MSKIDEAIRKLRQRATDTAAVQPSVRPGPDHIVGTGRSDKPFTPAGSQTVRVNGPQVAALGYAVPDEDRAVLAAQYRVIKRPLIAQAFGRVANRVEDGNFVQVTSSEAGEGKTFTCLNLALSIAQEKDYSVLLVDGDVLNPRLSQALGLADREGFLDYLAEPGRSAAALAHRTDLPGLSVMPSGAPREYGAELLSSGRMAAFLTEVVRRYPGQMVILDSPPVLPTSEARVIAESAGQIVVVVRAGHTPQDSVRQTVEALPTHKPTNFILNRVRGRTVHGTYDYGYVALAPSAENSDKQARE